MWTIKVNLFPCFSNTESTLPEGGDRQLPPVSLPHQPLPLGDRKPKPERDQEATKLVVFNTLSHKTFS